MQNVFTPRVISFVRFWGVPSLIVLSVLLWAGTVDVSNDQQVGERVLHALYDYEDLVAFSDNIEVLESLTTSEVFHRMTMDNADRILSVYLKFRGNTSKVNIVESGDGFIIYSLVSESIEPERLFLYTYEVEGGLVSSINEGEITPFVTNAGWDVDTSITPYPNVVPVF